VTSENVVNYTVVVSVANTRRQLLPGMTARVNFVTRSADDVLKVANAALRFRPPTEEKADNTAEAPAAQTARQGRGRRTSTLHYLDANGELKSVRVQTGVTDGSFTEVRGEGVREGMKVIAGTLQRQTAESESSTNPFQGNSGQQRGRRPGGF
jgi:HlyD family secretion protein